jgi:putative membrane protein
MVLVLFNGISRRSRVNQLQKNFFKRLAAGFVIGVGGILPGVSGGIMAVSMGLYKRMLEAVAEVFRHPKRNILFLLPIGIGGLFGLLLTGRLLEWLLANWRMPMLYLFMGLVAGGIPTLIREGNKQNGFRPRYLIATALGALFVAAFAVLNNRYTGGAGWDYNYLTASFSGGIVAVGTVIPGISTSFILIMVGVYDAFLSSLNRFEIVYLMFAGIGFVVVAGLLVLLVRKMFNRHPGWSYYAVLGFLTVSIVMIFPGFAPGWTQLLNIVLLILGFIASMLMEKMMEKDG